MKNSKYVLPYSLWGSGIWEQLSWVVLAQGLRRLRSDVPWGCVI